MYATKTLASQDIERHMLVMHKDKPWRVSSMRNGKLYVHRCAEATYLTGKSFEIILDRNNEPVREAS